MAALGSQPLIISGAKNREDRAELDKLPVEASITFMAEHAVENFMGGTAPEQAID